jgi:aldose 1-epimerase
MFMHNKNRSITGILTASVLLAAGCRQQPATQSEAAPQPAAPKTIQIGGADVLTLSRQATNSGSKPEFLSVILLPGRGMNMLQVTAAIPGKGEIPLLRSPSVADAASRLTGTGMDQLGGMSTSLGGAFLIPYPNRIVGEPSPDGKSVITAWRGHTLALPAISGTKPGGPAVAIHGLIAQAKVRTSRPKQPRMDRR